MALTIRVVREMDPWDAFLEESGFLMDDPTVRVRGKGDVLDMLKQYTDFLEKKRTEAGACPVCGWRFRKKEEGD
jgi:hypothetical protein